LHLQHVWLFHKNETRLYSSGVETFFKAVCHSEEENCIQEPTFHSYPHVLTCKMTFCFPCNFLVCH
jgi:hypothetical protein